MIPRIKYQDIKPLVEKLLPGFTLTPERFSPDLNDIYRYFYTKTLNLIDSNDISEVSKIFAREPKDQSIEAQVIRRLSIERAFVSNPSQWTPYLNLLLLNLDGTLKDVNAYHIPDLYHTKFINQTVPSYTETMNENEIFSEEEILIDSQQLATLNAEQYSNQFGLYLEHQIRTDQDIRHWFASLLSTDCYATATMARCALEQTFAKKHPNYMKYFKQLFFLNQDTSPRLTQEQVQVPLNHEVTSLPQQTQPISTLTNHELLNQFNGLETWQPHIRGDQEFLNLFNRFQAWPSSVQPQNNNPRNGFDNFKI